MNSSTKTFFVITFFFSLLSLLLTPSASAAGIENCPPIYGGGTTCVQSEQVTIDVTVQDPEANKYVDNLTANQSMYAPGEIVLLRIAVKNTDKKNELQNLTVTNIFPPHLMANTANKKTASWTIETLKKEEEKVFYAQGIVAAADTIPQDTVCGINQATVTVGDTRSQDNARFCINKIDTKKVLPAQTKSNPPTTKGGLPVFQPTQTKRTPDTGPETLALAALIPMAGAGWYLRRKAEKKAISR